MTLHHHRRSEPKKYFHTERAKKSTLQQGGYVKSQVQIISTSNNQLSVKETAPARRLSSDYSVLKESLPEKQKLKLPPVPKPSKSSPIVMAPKAFTAVAKNNTANAADYKKSSSDYTSLEYTNRKTSLKKMGACAIKVECDDGSIAIYALGRSIGKGQFGEVFGGLNMDTGEYVAIKRIKRNQMDCDDMNEVGVLKHLNNEHIVRYVGFSKDKEYLNIILEYVEMGSLHNNIKAFGKFPEKLAASYTFKILSGLHYLHSKDVIHCDLKAANILTTKTGSLKLTDFGVSLSLKMKDDENTGEPAGTPNWMAPEVIKFAGASAKSDIWSLGCTIVEMLTGKPPYAGMPSFTALYRIVEDDEPPIPKNIILSEDGREFLLACFKKNPQDRPTAYDLMQSKWMAPYFKPSPAFNVIKSKSETLLEPSDRETLSDAQNYEMTHEFVDYQTNQVGEKCYGCKIQMKKIWIKNCQGK
ncbi:kinase-like domain-containing protein [Mucor mucedo]|uniref:kinase-like domain-containing protein n=1 Tax=Mucor mucedo TaxID=29922 RepID=UPI00221E422D|nr:kinase-like domain-containing protein [Mucor mucedo]KAI7896522.1 kinase-like domain-containing protein [Mucor mucedo]